MADQFDRRMNWVAWGLGAAMALVIGINQCKGQYVKFIPQPRPSEYVMVYDVLFCSPADSVEPMTANLAIITRWAPPELPLLNPYARGYEQGRTGRHILLRVGDTVQDLSDGFIIGVATEAIDYDGTAWTKAAALYSFLWRKTRNPIDQQLNKALSEQPFWGDFDVQIPAGGGCQRMAAAALRPRDKRARRELAARSIEINIPSRPALDTIGRVERFDILDWDRQAAEALRDIARAACLVRPSSVESEGCGAWYG